MPAAQDDEMIPWASREGLIFLRDLETIARALGESGLAEGYRDRRLSLLLSMGGVDAEK